MPTIPPAIREVNDYRDAQTEYSQRRTGEPDGPPPPLPQVTENQKLDMLAGLWNKDIEAYPQARQPGEGWGDFLKRSTPEAIATMLLALSAIGFRGPIKAGPAKGLTPQDFIKAKDVARAADAKEMAEPILDMAIAGGPRRADGAYSTEMLRGQGGVSPARGSYAKDIPGNPYERAALLQAMRRRAANTR